MAQRLRFLKGTQVEPTSEPEWLNPNDYQSEPDARVQLELEHRGLPFAYRWFDGDAPTMKMLIPDYHPEFTLREYKIVIAIIGGFYGTLPGVLDRTALAKVALEKDGWKMVIWFEHEIKEQGANAMFDRDLPELRNAVHLGVERVSPYGHAMTMQTRRQYLRGLALLRKIFGQETTRAASDSGRRRTKFRRRGDSDSGRYRPLSARYKPTGD